MFDFSMMHPQALQAMQTQFGNMQPRARQALSQVPFFQQMQNRQANPNGFNDWAQQVRQRRFGQNAMPAQPQNALAGIVNWGRRPGGGM